MHIWLLTICNYEMVSDVQCPLLEYSPLHLLEGNGVGFDDIVTFSCKTGFTMDTKLMYHTTTCTGNGEWSNEIDECKRKTSISIVRIIYQIEMI